MLGMLVSEELSSVETSSKPGADRDGNGVSEELSSVETKFL